MWPRLTAMSKNVGLGATGNFQFVGKDGKAIEGSLIVDLLGFVDQLGCQPGCVDGGGMERVAEQA